MKLLISVLQFHGETPPFSFRQYQTLIFLCFQSKKSSKKTKSSSSHVCISQHKSAVTELEIRKWRGRGHRNRTKEEETALTRVNSREGDENTVCRRMNRLVYYYDYCRFLVMESEEVHTLVEVEEDGRFV